MVLIDSATPEKLRGGYYTPPMISSFILEWAYNNRFYPRFVLEPSCGDGAFLKQAALLDKQYELFTAIEYNESEAEKAKSLNIPKSKVLCQDFHDFCLSCSDKFDLIIGNPPYIRYQYYDSIQQSKANAIFASAGLRRNKMTNAWVTFVIGSALLLSEHGRMGFVLPTELLMVKYASQLRNFLAKAFNQITIISFKDLIFDNIQQDVLLLLCERNGTTNHKIDHIELSSPTELANIVPSQFKSTSKQIDFRNDKWTYYFLDSTELDFLNDVSQIGIPSFSSFADIEVGITTGANHYFTVTHATVSDYQLAQYARPMVGRSVQLHGLSFTPEDWQKNNAQGVRSNLLVFDTNTKQTANNLVKSYLLQGELQGIDTGYKTSIRDDWYVIPSVKLSDALFLRRNHYYPKFVLNSAHAYTTDTMHRVYIRKGVNPKALVASYYNSLSFAFTEILGRNFGGGCLELMPSEVAKVPLPYSENNEFIFDQVDKMVRANVSTDQILDFTDEHILVKGLGFSERQVLISRNIWHKLLNRRLKRNAK